MLSVTNYRATPADGQQYYLRWPVRGGFARLVGLLFATHLAVVTTPVLAAQVALVNPSVVPEPFTTVAHGAFGFVAVVALGSILRSDAVITTYRFEQRTAIRNQLKREPPDRWWPVRHGGLVAVGAALCWQTYDRFLYTLVNVLDLLVIDLSEFQWTLTAVDGLYSAVFLVGFFAFAIGADRLFVDGLRWFIRRRHPHY